MSHKTGKTAIVHFMPSDKKVKVTIGTTLLNAALKNRIALAHKCNGKCSCTTCRVKYISGSISSMQPCEDRVLRDDLKSEGFRLACQFIVLGDVTVEIPEDPLKAAIRAQLNQKRDEGV